MGDIRKGVSNTLLPAKKCTKSRKYLAFSMHDNILSFLANKYPLVSKHCVPYIINFFCFFLPQTGQYKKNSEEETGVDPELLQVEYTRSYFEATWSRISVQHAGTLFCPSLRDIAVLAVLIFPVLPWRFRLAMHIAWKRKSRQNSQSLLGHMRVFSSSVSFSKGFITVHSLILVL
jgi:hypothetical protein